MLLGLSACLPACLRVDLGAAHALRRWHVRLGDFGMCIHRDEVAWAVTRAGTHKFRSPEMLRLKYVEDIEADDLDVNF
jgi:hypothetical protein